MFSCGDETCGFEDGTYTVTSTNLNGNCEDMPLRLVSPTAYPPECSQRFEYDDSCGVTQVRQCMLDGVTGRYIITLEPKGSGYIGLYQRNDPVCSGLFAVEYVAQ